MYLRGVFSESNIFHFIIGDNFSWHCYTLLHYAARSFFKEDVKLRVSSLSLVLFKVPKNSLVITTNNAHDCRMPNMSQHVYTSCFHSVFVK